jgi:tRNA(Ile)-lysidine synthase
LTFQQTLAIDRLLLTGGAQGTIQAPGGLRVRRVGDGIVLSVGESQVRDRVSSSALAVPGFTAIPESLLSLRSDLLEEWAMEELAPDAWTALFDADRVGQDLHVRRWEPGDRFIPLGMGGRKKLQDFFVDAKVPRDQRGSIPLVVSGGQIAWVVGFRVDERFKVTDSTRRILRVRVATTGDQAR